MPPLKEMTIHCDKYIVNALEVETQRINQVHTRAGQRRIPRSEIAREVLADWAVRTLRQGTAQRPEPAAGSIAGRPRGETFAASRATGLFQWCPSRVASRPVY